MAEWNGVELDGLVLHSGRLTLRPWQPSDAVELVTPLGVPGKLRGAGLSCAVAENTTGGVVGAVSLRVHLSTPDDGAAAEIGYWTAVSARGNGYASEAAQTLSRFGFANGLSRIVIRCEAGDVASAAVALRAGYRYEGVLRAGGPSPDGPSDHALFARLRSDDGNPVEPAWPRPPTLSDGVVALRVTRPEDWPTVLAEMDNPLARRWSLVDREPTSEDARARARRAGLDWLVGQQAPLLICDASSGDGAGTIVLRQSGPPNVVNIGYGVLPEFRGRNFTSRALDLVADWAFTMTPIERLELGCKADNIASARAAEHAGFVQEAALSRRLANPDGGYSDEIMFARLRPEVRTSHNPTR